MNATSYTVTLEVLTPVHVGSGDTVNALGYLREGDALHVVDPDRWTEWLGQQGRAEQFVGWMERVLQITDRQQQRGVSLTRFVREELRRRDIVPIAEKTARYSLKMEGCGEPEPLRGFKTHIRDARGRAYLPGSSLKGAIRTALIEELLLADEGVNRRLAQPLHRTLEREGQKRPHESDKQWARRMKSAIGRFWQNVEYRLIRGSNEQGEMTAHYDLLRFVLVSDSEPLPQEQVSLRKVCSEGTRRPTDTWIEALRPGASTRFTLSLVPDAPLELLKLADDLRDYLVWETLMEVLYERAERRLARELQYAYPPAVRNRLQELRTRNRPDAPLLCVGWGQGYLGTTVMGLVQDERAQEYARLIEKMRPALPRGGQGVQPNRFPKTRRAVRNAREEAVYPLGWVQLRVG